MAYVVKVKDLKAKAERAIAVLEQHKHIAEVCGDLDTVKIISNSIEEIRSFANELKGTYLEVRPSGRIHNLVDKIFRF